MANLIEKIKDRRAPAPETPERRDVPVAHPDPQQGLTSVQVAARLLWQGAGGPKVEAAFQLLGEFPLQKTPSGLGGGGDEVDEFGFHWAST